MATTRTTRSTKVGPRTTLVQRTTNGGKTSNSFRTRIKNGPNSWITKTMSSKGFTDTFSTTSGGMTRSTSTRSGPHSNAHVSTSKPSKPYKSNNRNSSRGSSGLGGTLVAALIFALVAGVTWLFSLFSKSK